MIKLQIMYKPSKANYATHQLKILLKEQPAFPSSKIGTTPNRSLTQLTTSKINAARLIAEHFDSIFNGAQPYQHTLSSINQSIKEEELDRSQIIQILDNKLSLAVSKFNRNVCTMLETSKGLKEYCYGGLDKNKFCSIQDDYRQDEGVLKKIRAGQKFLEELTSIIQCVVRSISTLIELINRQNPWCQCDRVECPIRYQQSSTKQLIVESIAQTCKITLSKESKQINRSQQLYKYFTFQNDFTCNIQSFRKLQTPSTVSEQGLTQKPKKQGVLDEVIKSIAATKIEKQQRIKCPFFNDSQCHNMIMNFSQF